MTSKTTISYNNDLPHSAGEEMPRLCFKRLDSSAGLQEREFAHYLLDRVAVIVQ